MLRALIMLWSAISYYWLDFHVNQILRGADDMFELCLLKYFTTQKIVSDMTE